MMKKILIVSDTVLGETLAAVIGGLDAEVILSMHSDAAFVFATEDPTHVLICECDKGMVGEKTHDDIALSLIEQTIIRCGFSSSNDEDYLQLPFLLEELLKKLHLASKAKPRQQC
jgi:hypothetical protein